LKVQSLRAKIAINKQVAAHAYKMTLMAPAIAKKAAPGQFVMVRVTDACLLLLRRPFGIHSVKGSNVDILYGLAGVGTKLLSQKKPGGYLDLLGPLGKGFDWRSGALVRQSPVLIAGGIGVAPLVFLAEKLKKLKPVVLLGAKTKSHILCEKEFKALGCDVKVATDDGSKGYKGFVSELLISVIASLPSVARNDVLSLYACGPRSMLKATAAIAKQYNISAQVSLEEHMACGIGACLGCVVKVKSKKEKGKSFEHKRVCKDGPVFDAKEIVWVPRPEPPNAKIRRRGTRDEFSAKNILLENSEG